MKNALIILILVLVVVPVQAESGKEFLKKVQENYEDLKSLEMTMDYKLYKGYKGAEVIEKYQGAFMRNKKSSYRKIQHTQIIKTSDFYLKVSGSEKLMVISKPIAIEEANPDIRETLKWCRDVRVSEASGSNVLSLIIKEKTDIPYSKVELEVDGNYWIRKITFYYSGWVDFSDEFDQKDMDFPRLEISYTSLNKKWKDRGNLCEIERYLTETDQGYVPTTEYSDYKIINLLNKQ